MAPFAAGRGPSVVAILSLLASAAFAQGDEGEDASLGPSDGPSGGLIETEEDHEECEWLCADGRGVVQEGEDWVCQDESQATCVGGGEVEEAEAECTYLCADGREPEQNEEEVWFCRDESQATCVLGAVAEPEADGEWACRDGSQPACAACSLEASRRLQDEEVEVVVEGEDGGSECEWLCADGRGPVQEGEDWVCEDESQVTCVGGGEDEGEGELEGQLEGEPEGELGGEDGGSECEWLCADGRSPEQNEEEVWFCRDESQATCRWSMSCGCNDGCSWTCVDGRCPELVTEDWIVDTGEEEEVVVEAEPARVHVVQAEMTLNIASTASMAGADGQLSAEAEGALKASIASQAGVDPNLVAAVTVTVKVAGSAPMQVANPATFAASLAAKRGVEAGLAEHAGVAPESVSAVLTEGRRLAERPAERRLQGTVNVAYEILSDFASSESLAGSLQASDAAALSSAVSTQLEAEGIPAVTVDEITASPAVSVSYEIHTTDPAVAEAAEGSIGAAVDDTSAQDALLASITANMATAGVVVDITGVTVQEPSTVVQAAPTPPPPPVWRTSTPAPTPPIEPVVYVSLLLGGLEDSQAFVDDSRSRVAVEAGVANGASVNAANVSAVLTVGTAAGTVGVVAEIEVARGTADTLEASVAAVGLTAMATSLNAALTEAGITATVTVTALTATATIRGQGGNLHLYTQPAGISVDGGATSMSRFSVTICTLAPLALSAGRALV